MGRSKLEQKRDCKLKRAHSITVGIRLHRTLLEQHEHLTVVLAIKRTALIIIGKKEDYEVHGKKR